MYCRGQTRLKPQQTPWCHVSKISPPFLHPSHPYIISAFALCLPLPLLRQSRAVQCIERRIYTLMVFLCVSGNGLQRLLRSALLSRLRISNDGCGTRRFEWGFRCSECWGKCSSCSALFFACEEVCHRSRRHFMLGWTWCLEFFRVQKVCTSLWWRGRDDSLLEAMDLVPRAKPQARFLQIDRLCVVKYIIEWKLYWGLRCGFKFAWWTWRWSWVVMMGLILLATRVLLMQSGCAFKDMNRVIRCPMSSLLLEILSASLCEHDDNAPCRWQCHNHEWSEMCNHPVRKLTKSLSFAPYGWVCQRQACQKGVQKMSAASYM